MNVADLNADQREFWSNSAGPKWVALQARMDQLLQPVLTHLLAQADLAPGQQVLDIGAGTGASCLQAADVVGPSGHVTGADISDTMTQIARARAGDRKNMTVLFADAATHDFAPVRFDRVISRFGMMFFTDPVAAFRNIARAMHPEATITFATWGEIAQNPYFTTPAQVAKSIIGTPPKSDPDAPGPFAFRDPQRVLDLLHKTGFTGPACNVVPMTLDAGREIQTLADCMCPIGPAEATLRHFDATPDHRQTLKDALSERLHEFTTPQGLRIPAQINFFTARATGPQDHA